jgi:hypothetical protein
MKKYAMDFIVNVLEEVKNNPTLSLAKIAENNNLTSGAPLIRWWIKRYNQFNKDIVEWRRNVADEKKRCISCNYWKYESSNRRTEKRTK